MTILDIYETLRVGMQLMCNGVLGLQKIFGWSVRFDPTPTRLMGVVQSQSPSLESPSTFQKCNRFRLERTYPRYHRYQLGSF
jgi:hypothetical protein